MSVISWGTQLELKRKPARNFVSSEAKRGRFYAYVAIRLKLFFIYTIQLERTFVADFSQQHVRLERPPG